MITYFPIFNTDIMTVIISTNHVQTNPYPAKFEEYVWIIMYRT